MFCSKCGKTLLPEATQCAACGHPVGQSRFDGSPYTSAQAHILPGAGAHEPITQAYTRTTYTSRGDEAVQGDADARTTYRPIYEGASAPEDVRQDMRAVLNGDEPINPSEAEAAREAEAAAAARRAQVELSEETQEVLDEMDRQLKMDEVDMSQFRARPITSSGQKGVSSDVAEYLQKFEGVEIPRRSVRRRAEEIDDYEENAAENGVRDDIDTDQSEVFDDIDEEEFEELRNTEFGLKQILKIVAVVVVVAALFIGGVMWVRHIRDTQPTSPIENVRQEMYDPAIELIEKHASEDNITEMLLAYTSSENGLVTLTTKLQNSASELSALLPEEATENEQLLLEALQKIETNIANCITSDALAVAQNDADSVAASDERWAVVENSIASLKNAKSAAELTGIINGDLVEVVEAEVTPTPTPSVNYNTLSKGDKSQEVLDMQNRLFELGFLLDDRDGNFGSNTQTAVKLFQHTAGLEVTGIADNATLTLMFSDDAPRTDLAQVQ